jgi:sugar-specific transcriptional regulator TrmB
MKPDTVALLDTLGVSRNEALTYLGLLESNSVSIRKLAVHTGINRGTTYEALKSLITVGLVSSKQKGEREYYTAESPEKILDLIRDKRRDLLDATRVAKIIVPTLLAQHSQQEGQPVVRYFENDDGVVTILKDVLETCRLMKNPGYYCYSSRRIHQYLYRKFPQFTERRITEGIQVKVISVGEGGEVAEASERKWLPESSSKQASSYMLIYGNRVAVISISSNLTPYGVVVEDGAAAAMQRLLFDQLWGYL